MVIALIIPKEAEQKPFTPPPFDEMAVLGEPSVPDGFGYSPRAGNARYARDGSGVRFRKRKTLACGRYLIQGFYQ